MEGAVGSHIAEVVVGDIARAGMMMPLRVSIEVQAIGPLVLMMHRSLLG